MNRPTELSELIDPAWVLIGSHGLWAADCLVPGCLWTTCASIPEAADAAAVVHTATEHADIVVAGIGYAKHVDCQCK